MKKSKKLLAFKLEYEEMPFRISGQKRKTDQNTYKRKNRDEEEINLNYFKEER